MSNTTIVAKSKKIVNLTKVEYYGKILKVDNIL